MITTVLICAAFSVVLYGWGRLGERLLEVRWPWPMTICTGLVMVIFLGGVINLLEIAYAATLNVIAVFGFLSGAGAIFLAAQRRIALGSDSTRPSARDVIFQAGPGALLILAGFLFVAAYLTPPTAFNVYDDFETYLHLPLRMLATGTLKPGIFSNFGVNTLGAQAFLHAFVAAHWPVGYVDAADALWGFALTGAAILVAGRRVKAPGWLTTLAVALMVAINPQYVNVSTSYIGSALLVFLLFLDSGMRNDTSPPDPASIRLAIITGMVYAALVALKSTFALVVSVHFVLMVVAIFITTGRVRTASRWALFTVASGFCCLLPWILNQAYKLLPAVSASSGSNAGQTIETYAGRPADALNLFSTDDFIYGFGTSYGHYTALAGMVLVCCAVLMLVAYRNRMSGNRHVTYAIAGCLTLPILYLLQMSLIGRWVMGYDTALRYAAPALLGIAPAAIVLAASFPRPRGATGLESGRLPHPATAILLGVACAGLIWSFSGSLTSRVRQAMEHGTALSFLPFNDPAKIEGYLHYNRNAFTPYTIDRFSGIQRLVPENEPLLVYVSLSMHFDFARNRIWNVDGGGLGSPLLDFPLAGSADEAARFFSLKGVRYIVWEYRGYAIPTPGDLRALANSAYPADRRSARAKRAFDRLLAELSERSEVLHDDGAIRLFRID